MADNSFADIKAIKDLEYGIHTFNSRMVSANSEIEHTIYRYFQEFERGLMILRERLRRAEENLERAERALERQRNRRVLVKDSDGDGYHWESADCSAEEAAVARCQAQCDVCRRRVGACSHMISDAQTKRHIHKEKFYQLKSKIAEAIDKIGPARGLVEKHLSTSVPSLSASPVSAEMSRPIPPHISQPSTRPTTSSDQERPRSPHRVNVNPRRETPVTDADRPRSPFGNGERITRDSVGSFRDGINKIISKYNNDENDG